MQFLHNLHVKLFIQAPNSEFSVRAWLNGSNYIDRFLLSCGASFSESLSNMLRSTREKAAVEALSQISEEQRSCLLESIIDTLLSFVDTLNLSSGPFFHEDKALTSCVEALLPWTFAVGCLSFDHPIMKSLEKRASSFVVSVIRFPSVQLMFHTGPSSAKKEGLVLFLKAIPSIDSLLLRIWGRESTANKDSAASQGQAYSDVNHNLTSCLIAARSCFQRLSIAVRRCIVHTCVFVCACERFRF